MAPSRGERGFAIIFAITVVSMLMAGIMITWSQASDFSQIVGSLSNRQRLTMINDAGVAFGRVTLFNVTHPSTYLGPMSAAPLRSFPSVPQGHALCADGVDCSKFYFLNTAAGTNFDTGNYVVAATCFPQDCSLPDSQIIGFEMRVLSTMPGGGQKLVEISYMP